MERRSLVPARWAPEYILVDPRRSDAKDLLNAKIKRRESFRPFAPFHS